MRHESADYSAEYFCRILLQITLQILIISKFFGVQIRFALCRQLGCLDYDFLKACDIQSTVVQFTFIFETEFCFLPIDLQTDSLTDGLTRQFLITSDRPTYKYYHDIFI